MSDMVSNRISVRLPQALIERLRKRSQSTGATESEMVREALAGYLGRSAKQKSAYELAADSGIIGTVRDAPEDLSTSRRHLNGFGKDK